MKGGEPIGRANSRVGPTSSPQLDTREGQGQAHVRREPIIGQGGSKEEKGRGLSGGLPVSGNNTFMI